MQRRGKDAVVIVVAGEKEQTVNFFLPLALLLARTALPLAVDILSLKPCLFLLFLLDG